MSRGEIKVGVIGLGFMGRVHLEAYREAGARLVAVCDGSSERLSGGTGEGGNLGEGGATALFDPDEVNATTDLDTFLATPGLRLVSVCTPTDTHAPIARRVIEAGKHLIIEKPVALDAAVVAELRDAADRAGVLCMPAMCMRFWPAWAWVKGAIDDGRFGAVRAARFERLGARPTWGRTFYSDERRSGGAMFDLHVHDTDFIVHAFGRPDSVLAVGDANHLSTVYRYARGPSHVTAQGGWLTGPSWPFAMRMLVEFEGGVAEFEFGREPELRVHLASGETLVPSVEASTGWRCEIEAMLEAVDRGHAQAPATMDSAVVSTGVLQAERQSLISGKPVRTSVGVDPGPGTPPHEPNAE